MTDEIITSPDELRQLVKDGYFFNFCVAFALNKGYWDAIKEKKEVKFSVGDYDVEFVRERMCFMIDHKIYFARIICANYTDGVAWIGGDNEDELIKDLLTELEKEL